MARTAPGLLTEHLGDTGAHLRRLSLGEDDREVVGERQAKSVGAEYTLERDIRGAATVKKHLRRAADRVAPRLRRQGVVATGLRVKIKTAAFRLVTRQMTLPRPTDDARPPLEAACVLLDEFDLNVPMRLVGLAAFGLGPAGGSNPALFLPVSGAAAQLTLWVVAAVLFLAGLIIFCRREYT